MKVNVKKIIFKSVATLLAFALFLVGYYALYLFCGYQRISDKQTLLKPVEVETPVPTGEELTAVTYNVGFGAYSSDYSFFMDGGEYARAYSEDAVIDNINGAIDTLQDEAPDFVFLQEVDIDGTRSHHVDQTELFAEELDEYDSVTAVNYDSPYFFYPLHEPIGKNKSGIMTLSRYEIKSAMRYSLPVEDSLYKYFDLDRAYSVSKMPTDNGKQLVLYNVHLSAYTSDGSIADEQLKILVADMFKEYEKGNYVIAAGDFNKDLLGDSSQYFERVEGEYTWAQPINTELIPEGLTVYAATNEPTCRNADSPYRGDGTDFVLTIDGMIASDNITVISSETVDTDFAHSDHNPVKFEIVLEAPQTVAE